ncbi:MAG: class I SAM-dependent methyltransferase [Anaerolineae bacterium]|nr:class I SAM-dependent methyltransferase [Anaerolineae bacterium]
MKKWIYEFLYRFPFVPIEWIFGDLDQFDEFTELVESGRIPPGRAIALGCGVGREAIYLAQHGFEVTGVDFSPTAIKRAKRRAQREGVDVDFRLDDLTDLQHVRGTFDLILDFGALNDLTPEHRDLYIQNVMPLFHPGSRFFMFCFDNKLPQEEVQQRFSPFFSIKPLRQRTEQVTSRSLSFYLMEREMEVIER